MTSFAERCRTRGVRSLATFGDSVTAALHIEPAKARWSNLLADAIGAATLYNKGISGTVLQQSVAADGAPHPDNGRSRYERDLLGAERGDAIAILYGTNDARYTGAPETFCHDNFVRDFREVLAGLFAAGYAADAIVIGSPPHLPDAGFAVGDNGFAGQTRDNFQRYVATVRDITREAGTFYAPVNERMSAEGGDSLVLDDHVHPNAAGHRKIAEIFAGATKPE